LSQCAALQVVVQGVQELRDPLVFTAADSGTDRMPVVWTSPASARATLSGGVTVQGWYRIGGGPTWTAHLPDSFHPHQLFVGGRRAPRARTPNVGTFFAISRILGNSTASTGVVFSNGTAPAVAQTRNAHPDITAVMSGWVLSLLSHSLGRSLTRSLCLFCPPRS
jgi:hypothetical protein